MRALGAIVIGIGAYQYDRAVYPPLRYASNDADGIIQYITTCWPKMDEAKVVRLSESDATLAAISGAFDTLQKGGPYDLQFVFLSGHGVVHGQDVGFIAQPAHGVSTLSLLDPANLDRLLASVTAARTVFILDCCNAEGIVRRMSFFSGLSKSDARLFVASSREEQLTWEDERIGHGIFTAHLLDLLNTGSSVRLNGLRDKLDVDGELFPVLCDQVPLYVLEHKQERQEPVKGGVSIRPVSLPVARAARRIKERTAFGTAVRRLRQIALGLALASLVFLIFAYGLGYYAQVDSNGDVTLRHGTKWLAPAFRYLPTLRADTGIAATDLSDDPASRYAVQAGDTSGFWTHMSREGYRAWYDSIRLSLDPKSAARYDVLLGAGAMRPVSRLTDESKPSDVAFAAWALLDDSDAKQLDKLFAHLLGADRINPVVVPFSANEMDFNILDLTQPELGSYADALRSAAAIDPDRTFVAYLGFLKANQMWLAHSSPEQHGKEAQRRAADDVADVLAVIAKAMTDRGEPALNPAMMSELTQLGEVGYAQLVHLALARATNSQVDRQSAASRALAAFHGNSSEPSEAAAIRQLEDALDSSPASQAIVEETYKRFVKAGGPEQSDLTAFLIGAADKKAIPSSVMTILLEKAQDAVTRHADEFIDSEYTRILAHAMRQVPDSSRPLVYQLIDLVAAGVTPLASSTAEIYTTLGRQGLDTPAMLQWIITEAAAAPLYQPQARGIVSEPLPGMSIVVGHGPWLEALAVLGANRTLTQVAVEILEKHANDPSLRDVIVHALVRQPAWRGRGCWKTGCSRILEALSDDAVKRRLVSDLLSEELADLPRAEFIKALDELRKERESEIEPEIRIALGLATINAQLARLRTMPVGRQLFE
jgi:hypothetical protein